MFNKAWDYISAVIDHEVIYEEDEKYGVLVDEYIGVCVRKKEWYGALRLIYCFLGSDRKNRRRILFNRFSRDKEITAELNRFDSKLRFDSNSFWKRVSKY